MSTPLVWKNEYGAGRTRYVAELPGVTCTAYAHGGRGWEATIRFAPLCKKHEENTPDKHRSRLFLYAELKDVQAWCEEELPFLIDYLLNRYKPSRTPRFKKNRETLINTGLLLKMGLT